MTPETLEEMTPEEITDYTQLESLHLARLYVGMAKERAALDAQLKEVKGKIKDLQTVLLQRFERDHVQNMHVDDMTIYVHSQLWAGANGDKEAMLQALKSCGLGDLVHEAFSAPQLSAIMREKRREFEAAEKRVLSPTEILERLPKELAETVRLSEQTELRARQGD